METNRDALIQIVGEVFNTDFKGTDEEGYADFADKLIAKGVMLSSDVQTTERLKAALEEIDALIAGQETLQKYIAEKNAEIEKLKKKLTLAECCICDVEDDLYRGSDNDWVSKRIEDCEKEVAAIDETV